jgi:RNA-binding protein 26
MAPSTDIPTSPRGRKRGLEYDDNDHRAPAKGPRLSADGQFSRHQNGNGVNYTNGSVYTSRDSPNHSWGGRNNGGHRGGMHGGMNGNAMGMGMGMGMGPMNPMGMFGMPGMNGGLYPPSGEKRQICRDYHSTYHIHKLGIPLLSLIFF